MPITYHIMIYNIITLIYIITTRHDIYSKASTPSARAAGWPSRRTAVLLTYLPYSTPL